MLKKISVKQLAVGMFVHGFEGAWVDHPFWRTKFTVDPQSLRRVQESGVEELWIDVSRGREVGAATPAASADATPLPPAAAPEAEAVSATRTSLDEEMREARTLRARTVGAMRNLFAQARLGQAVEPEACAPLVNDVVESINRNPEALINLLRLKSADDYTYLHSVAVCALMVALGRQLGFDGERCRAAGLAGMLHDLGKAAMPTDILNKPGRLTEPEFDIIKQHPVRGHEMLLATGAAGEVALDVCLHHHERVDGTGYPDGLAGERLSQLARMGAICDVYDAVTSDRPYKAGWDPAQALAQMATWKGHFDPTLFQAFVRSVGIYPTGSLVRMKSGRLAVITEQNPSALTRPKVKVFYSTAESMPLRARELDLASPSCQDRIEAREAPEKWNFPYLKELWAGDALSR
jgi:putative nucleotidyltransferase with HDIG domain